MILERKLTKEEQSELLNYYFGFYFEDDVLIDDDGNDFYGVSGNDKFDFSTLKGIFSYMIYVSEKQGYINAQCDIRKAIGLI